MMLSLSLTGSYFRVRRLASGVDDKALTVLPRSPFSTQACRAHAHYLRTREPADHVEMVRTDAQQHVVPDDVGLPRSARVVLLDRQIEENIPGNLRAQPLDARIEAPVESDPWMRATSRPSWILRNAGR
jgi:hypothetical protein